MIRFDWPVDGDLDRVRVSRVIDSDRTPLFDTTVEDLDEALADLWDRMDEAAAPS